MPQASQHQAFTESVTTHYPPAWDTSTGPTVTRQFYGTVVPNGAVPWTVPVQQSQSVGADVAPIVARIRQGYREVGETFERTYPGYEIGLRTSIPIGAESRPEVVPEKANLAFGLLIGLSLVLSLIVAFLAHDRLTSRRERERARRDRRKRRRDRDASAQTPPRA